MKQKRFPRLLLVIALVAVLTTTVYAYMFHKSQTVSNVFTPAEVTCKIVEGFDGETKSSIQVVNTGNIPAYIRIRLVAHWEDSKGNVVARDITQPSISYDELNWIKKGDYYYHRTPVDPDKNTLDNFLRTGISLEPETVPFNGVDYTYYQVIEVLAEAIQANPADAVVASWGVTVKDGKIS